LEAITAKQKKIDPYCQRRNCSPLNVLLGDVEIALISQGVPQPGNPALFGSRPLVTPYYCRLGDFLCFVFMCAYCVFDFSVYYCSFSALILLVGSFDL